MKPILFRLDEFLEFMQEAHSSLQSSKLSIKKHYFIDTFSVEIKTTFSIFDGREFVLIYHKYIKLEQVEKDTYSYFYFDSYQFLSAHKIWVYYSHNAQAAYYSNSTVSKRMVKLFEDCLPQSILNLISKHPDEEKMFFDYCREEYKDQNSLRTYISPSSEIKTRTLVQNNSKHNKKLNFIKSNAHKILIPKICYAYQLDLYNLEKEKEAAKILEGGIIFQKIDENDSPFFEDTNDEFDPAIFDDEQTLDQYGLDNTEPLEPSTANPLPELKLDRPIIEYRKVTIVDTPTSAPELDIPTLEFRKATTVDIPTSVPEFDLGFIDCKATHKSDFNLSLSSRLTGWFGRLCENLKVSHQFYIPLTDDQDISFKGRLMAAAKADTVTLSLYQTLNGQLIGVKQRNIAPDQSITVACVSSDKDEIFKFFGFSELAKQIYYQAGIDASRYVA